MTRKRILHVTCDFCHNVFEGTSQDIKEMGVEKRGDDDICESCREEEKEKQ